MSYNKILSWFCTEKGKQFSFALATTSTMGVFLSYAVPNTILLDKYRDIIRLYKSGMSVPLSDTIKQRFDVALKLCEVPEKENKLFQPFQVFGFDVFSAGTSYSRFGSIIGIPINFTYTDPDMIDRKSLQVGGNSVAWEFEEGKELLQSLVLSENAQIFAMAREIKMCQTPKLVLHTFYATLCTGLTYGLSNYFNSKLNLYARPLGMRIVLYALICGFTAGNFLLAKDLAQVTYETRIDKELKEKDPSLLEGGKEFYSQTLRRNIALRKLMGKEGESVYTVLGNENYLIRQRHLPLVQRRDFFKQKLEIS